MTRPRKKVKRRFVDPWADRNYRTKKGGAAKRYTKGTKKFSRKLGRFL